MQSDHAPRLATEADVPAIAALHVQAWEETYPGLLPRAAFDARNLDYRLTLWRRIIAGGAQISYLPDIGFAQLARQRDAALQDTYPLELYSFYTLKHAHGTGAAQALLRHAMGETFRPFTAEVLKGNARATAFYEKIGGQLLKETHETVSDWGITNIIYGWLYAIQLRD